MYGILSATYGVNDYILSILQLFAGLGVFLVGFKLLSENIEKLAASKLRRWFDKTSKSKIAGVVIGAGTTALLQSSATTTVMVVGFVNAGIMSLYQATAIIMGANIGTTITAQIASLKAIPIMDYVAVFACVGIFMNMLCKNEKIKMSGLLIAGVGLIFLGLNYMSNAVQFYKDVPAIHEMFSKIGNPFLLLFLGIALTALVQSSSVITSLIIIMVGAGLSVGNDSNDVLFLILGSNIGSCITAILSSLGANTNAKRASLIHLMFNVVGTFIFTIVLLLWHDFMDVTFARIFSKPETQIAMFHTFFNVACTIMFLPFAKVFVKVATKLIPDKKRNGSEEVSFLDSRFLKTPAIAIAQANKEAARMAEFAITSLKVAVNGFMAGDENAKDEVELYIVKVAEMEKKIVEYMINISSTSDLSFSEEKIISAIHHATSDIIRIAELSDNITKYTRRTKRDNLEFSQGVKVSLTDMCDKIYALYEKTMDVFDKKDVKAIKEVDEIENEIDAARKTMVADHIRRLNEGKCNPASSGVYINLVGNLERAADHLTYVAHCFDDSPSV